MADVRPCTVFNIGYIKDAIRERTAAMPRTTTMTVRLGGTLSEFVAANVGEDGSFENVSEYIRDLIRRDQARILELDAIRNELIKGEQSGEPLPFDAQQFKARMAAQYARKTR
jgi:antitoxin ParD1/3/4